MAHPSAVESTECTCNRTQRSGAQRVARSLKRFGFALPEALRIGLVSRLSEGSVVDDALAIAETLCGYGKFGVESTKQVLWANLEASSIEAALHVENRSQLLASTSGEMRAAAAAFVTRKKD